MQEEWYHAHLWELVNQTLSPSDHSQIGSGVSPKPNSPVSGAPCQMWLKITHRGSVFSDLSLSVPTREQMKLSEGGRAGLPQGLSSPFRASGIIGLRGCRLDALSYLPSFLERLPRPSILPTHNPLCPVIITAIVGLAGTGLSILHRLDNIFFTGT